MKDNGLSRKLIGFLKKENNLQLSIAVVAAVALLLVVFGSSLFKAIGRSANANAQQTNAAAQQSEPAGTDLESRLETILSNVQNAGQVRVMITYATGPEIVPALSTSTQKNSSEGGANGSGSTTESTTENTEPVVVQGDNGTEPMVLVQKEPVVLGVLVVAEGASRLDVQIKLMQAVQTGLQISPDRIEVLPMSTANYKEAN